MKSLQERLEEKAGKARNPAGKRALSLALEKRSNLVLGCDLTSPEEFSSMLDETIEELVILKTHVDIIDGWTPEWWATVVDLCKEHDVLIFEDRKFADIGSTVKRQYTQGIYKIAQWAQLVNCHAVPGEGIIEGLREAADGISDGLPRGCLVLAQMSSKGTLATGEYMRKAVEMAGRHPDFCAGFIGNGAVASELTGLARLCPPGMLIATPGVQLNATSGALGQQYASPQQAVGAGADFIIVGSGISNSADPKGKAKEYRTAGWDT